MSTFDAMALAIDWLDAYRANDLDLLISLYDDAGQLECGCGGQTVVVGKVALSEYWKQRFRDQPARELEDMQMAGDGIKLSYRTEDGVVSVILRYGSHGKILFSQCGPTLN